MKIKDSNLKRGEHSFTKKLRIKVVKNIQNRNRKFRGFSIVEVLLSASLFLIVTTGVVATIVYIRESAVELERAHEATRLTQSGIEISKDIRNRSFVSLVDGTYGIGISGGNYVLTGSSDTNNGITRSVTVSTIDASTKEIIVTSSWITKTGATKSVTLTERVSDWKDTVSLVNDWGNIFIDETQVLTGTLAPNNIAMDEDGNVYVAKVNGATNFESYVLSTNSLGLVTTSSVTANDLWARNGVAYLANGGNLSEIARMNISSPSTPLIALSYDITQSTSTTDAMSVAANDTHLFVGRINVNSGPTPELLIYSFSGGPIFTLTYVGGLDLNATPRDIVVNGNTLYIATESNSEELVVVNITNPASPSILTTHNMQGAPGQNNSDAVHLAFRDNLLVAGRVNGEIFFYDITAPASPVYQTYVSAASTSHRVNGLDTDGRYVFANRNAANPSFFVYDALNPAAPTVANNTLHIPTATGYELLYNDVDERIYVLERVSAISHRLRILSTN